MWKKKGEKIKLDVSKIRKEFKTISDEKLTLIFPQKNLWEWEDEERFLRSLVVDKDGFIVSSGWPKFGNYDEFSNDTDILNQYLYNNSNVQFTNKEDGSLCIRFVYNNKVFMRTRGTLYGGEDYNGIESYRNRFLKTSQKYPILLDSNWMNDRSLLFEYVAPNNLVVIKYKEEDLIFLGFVTNELQIGSWDETKSIAEKNNLNLVKTSNLPYNPIELLKIIKTWKEEGIVARCGQTFVKIKSAYYLAQHRLKFSISYKFVVEFIELSRIKNKEDLINELKSCEYDWEIIETVIPFFDKYMEISNYIDSLLDKANNILINFKPNVNDPIKKKKELAMTIINEDKLLKTFVFSIYDGHKDKIKTLRKKVLLTRGNK